MEEDKYQIFNNLETRFGEIELSISCVYSHYQCQHACVRTRRMYWPVNNSLSCCSKTNMGHLHWGPDDLCRLVNENLTVLELRCAGSVSGTAINHGMSNLEFV